MSKDKKTVTFEELAVSNTLEIQSVIRILERKGLITLDEMEKTVEDRSPDNIFIITYPFDCLRSNKRFQLMLKKIVLLK